MASSDKAAPVGDQADAGTPVIGRAFLTSRSGQALAPYPLFVPEWVGTVYVRRLTAGQLDRYYDDLREHKDQGRAVVLAWAIGDEKGAPVFDVKSASDRATLAGLDAEGAERVIDEFRAGIGLGRGN